MVLVERRLELAVFPLCVIMIGIEGNADPLTEEFPGICGSETEPVHRAVKFEKGNFVA